MEPAGFDDVTKRLRSATVRFDYPFAGGEQLEIGQIDLDGPWEPKLDVHSLIGEGGFAVVYRAYDSDLHRDVAVKILKDVLDLDTFERECEVLGRLDSHPNVVTVHRTGRTSDGHPFLVMEFVRDGSLADKLVSGGMRWTDAVELLLPICEAVSDGHAKGIYHCDIKPANILMSPAGPKLADYGVAGMAGETRPPVGVSWLHAPPEAAGSASRNARVDIYSLGSTLYTMIAGRAPFAGDDESTSAIVKRVSTEPAPELPVAPMWLRRLVASCLAKDPSERPQEVLTLITKLEGGLERTRHQAEDPVDHALPLGSQFVEPLASAVADTPPFSPKIQAPEDAPLPHDRRLRPGWLIALAASLLVLAGLVVLYNWPAGGDDSATPDSNPPTTPTGTGSTETETGSTETEASTSSTEAETSSTETDTGSTDTGSTDTDSTDTGSTDTGSTDTGSTPAPQVLEVGWEGAGSQNVFDDYIAEATKACDNAQHDEEVQLFGTTYVVIDISKSTSTRNAGNGIPAYVDDIPKINENNIIVGTDESEALGGYGGHDIICGYGGDDSIAGNDGDDILIGGTGADDFTGNAGNDLISADQPDLRVIPAGKALGGGPGVDFCSLFDPDFSHGDCTQPE